MKTECVTAVIRVRPLNKKEKSEKDIECIEFIQNTSLQIKHLQNNSQSRRFTFDRVFDSKSAQQDVYTETTFPIVEKVFEGYNGTVFAYGQTGCGKTHTMVGNLQNEIEIGIIPRVFKHCRSIVAEEKNKQFLIHGSFLEIYNECIYDLLDASRDKLSIKNDPKKGIYVDKLKKIPMNSLSAMNKVMDQGNQNRTVGATAMNEGSSRSHSIFIIYIESANQENSSKQYTSSKLSLVDLAGSEKTKKTQATGKRLIEGTKINQSLSVLGNVIKALVDGKAKFIPYRDSKLTRLLQDSLGGNTKTVMIAAVSPAFSNFEESLSTLRYANRAKSIKNKPVVNIDEKDLLIKQYQADIEDMKKKLMLQQKDTIFSNETIDQGIKNYDKQKSDQNEQKIQEEQQRQKLLVEQLKKLQDQLSNRDQQEDIDKLQKEREKIKLQKKKELEKKIEQQKKKQEEDCKKIIKESEKTQKEIDDIKILIQDKKNELEDLESENLDQRTSLVNEYKELNLSLKFYKQIILNQIGMNEIQKLKKNAKFSDKENNYKLPNFQVNKNKIKIIKIPKHEFQALQDKKFQNRKIIFITQQIKQQFEEQKIQKNVQKTDYKLRQKELNKIEEHFTQFPSDQKPNKYYNSKQYKLKSIKKSIIQIINQSSLTLSCN